jgi:hypothetical protein
MGTRSAAVQSAEQYQQLFSTLEDAFRQAGFDLVEDKSEARYQAYFWFGKRRERREQFSNVTDGMNITTEYTWAMTLTFLPPIHMRTSSWSRSSRATASS